MYQLALNQQIYNYTARVLHIHSESFSNHSNDTNQKRCNTMVVPDCLKILMQNNERFKATVNEQKSMLEALKIIFKTGSSLDTHAFEDEVLLAYQQILSDYDEADNNAIINILFDKLFSIKFHNQYNIFVGRIDKKLQSLRHIESDVNFLEALDNDETKTSQMEQLRCSYIETPLNNEKAEVKHEDVILNNSSLSQPDSDLLQKSTTVFIVNKMEKDLSDIDEVSNTEEHVSVVFNTSEHSSCAVGKKKTWTVEQVISLLQSYVLSFKLYRVQFANRKQDSEYHFIPISSLSNNVENPVFSHPNDGMSAFMLHDLNAQFLSIQEAIKTLPCDECCKLSKMIELDKTFIGFDGAIQSMINKIVTFNVFTENEKIINSNGVVNSEQLTINSPLSNIPIEPKKSKRFGFGNFNQNQCGGAYEWRWH